VIAALAFSIPLCQEEVWESGLALNRFSVAAGAAALLAAFNLIWVMLRLPETLRPGEVAEERRAGLVRLLRHLRHLNAPGLPRTNLAYFLYMSAFAAMEFTLVFLAVERLGYRPRDNTWMFVFVGLIIAAVQGGAIRRVAPRYGERKVTLFGLAVLIPGFVLVGLAQGSGLLYVGLAFMAVGSALVMPCLSALASRYAPPEAQGLVLGTLRSMGSLSRAVGPLAGGLLYWRFGSALPYYLAALFLLVPLWLALGLPRAERGSIAGRDTP
jgi:predicted MFS family arabinose efflux permease